MAKVCVTRTGSPLWWNTMNSTRASESGECDTEPCIRYLVNAGFEVAYYGQIRNYTENNNPLPGLKVFPVDFSGLQPIMGSLSRSNSGRSWHNREIALEDVNRLYERCEQPCKDLMDWEPDIVLEYCGDKFTHYSPYNDNGVEVLDACWQYGFPAGYMYHRTGYKRNLIITDPVLYPRNGEMLGSWPESWPNSILSQEENSWTQTIQGRKVKSYARYAGVENWLTWAMSPRVRRSPYDYEVLIAGHVHHKRQGQRTDHRLALWEGLLDQALNGGRKVGICGRGWDDVSNAVNRDNAHYVGVIPTFTQVMDFMASGKGGPIVPQRNGFNTSKARFYALNGACPYMFENDADYKFTYDSRERILPLNHVSRWMWNDQSCLDMSEDVRYSTINEILQKTTPNFDVLHELIEVKGENKDGRFGYYTV